MVGSRDDLKGPCSCPFERWSSRYPTKGNRISVISFHMKKTSKDLDI